MSNNKLSSLNGYDIISPYYGVVEFFPTLYIPQRVLFGEGMKQLFSTNIGKSIVDFLTEAVNTWLLK